MTWDLQKDVGVARDWPGRKGDRCWVLHVLGPGLCAPHTVCTLLGCGEDVGAAFPVTDEETQAQPGDPDENGKSSLRSAGAGLPECPPHPVGKDGLPAPTRTWLLPQTILGGPCSGDRFGWGGTVGVAEGIRFLLTFVEGLLRASRLRCHFLPVSVLWGGSSEPMAVLCYF